MPMPVEKVEVGFQITPSGAILFTLDDPVRGVLDNTEYKLGGITLEFIDVTSRVRNFTISRGRSSLFSAFPAGQVNVEFNNHDRAFDPLYAASPFVGNIVPKREIKITTGNSVQYTGWIDDWNYSYTPDGDSTAEAVAYDATSILSGQLLAAGTPIQQLSGARVTAVLDEVGWLPSERNIDTGGATLGTAVIEENTNAMNYLQQIALSEPGFIFIDKSGKLTFLDRQQTPTTAGVTKFGGTAIPFQNLDVNYGSDNLYNRVILDRTGGGTATVTDNQSVNDYGLRTFTQSGLLMSDDIQLAELAINLAVQYSQPEYRFSSLEVALHKLSPAQQAQVLALELGSICEITFTPNNIGDPIIRFLQIIAINHTVRPETHFIDFSFQTLDAAYIVLDDAEFGKLDSYSLSW